MLAGSAEGLAGTEEGAGGDQEETAEEDGWGWEQQPAEPGCTERTRQLKEGAAVSVKHTGRRGQLACPEDTLERLCRLPKAIWLRRTYLAHQVTIVSARLPQPTLSCPPSPSTLPRRPRCHFVNDTWTSGWKTNPKHPPESQGRTPNVRAATGAWPDC